MRMKIAGLGTNRTEDHGEKENGTPILKASVPYLSKIYSPSAT